MKYHVSYDSNTDGVFIITKADGPVFRFQESEDGLHYLVATKQSEGSDGATMMMSTVSQNKGSYVQNDYLCVVRAM